MFALVRDKQQISDTAPAITDVFTSDTDPHTMLNANRLGRFDLLKRWNYTVDSHTSSSVNFNYFTKRSFHVRYNGPTANDIEKNGLYLVIITSDGTNYPTISINSRISWHDN